MHKQHQRYLVTLMRFALTVSALTILTVSALAQQPFTYQGFLRVNGLPANGEFDFRFRLFDSATGTNQVGTTVIADDKQVRQGFYTVVLDFGNVWTGGQRWLEIAIRPGNSTGSYTTLSPRVQLTPVPLAHQAFSVPWSGISGIPAGFADGIDNDTTYSAGAGLSLSGTTFSIASGGIVTGMLADGAVTDPKISSVSWSKITGAPNFLTGVVAQNPLTGAGTSGNPLRLINGTSAGQILKWNGAQWALANDNDTTYSAGAGLSLSGTTFSVATGGITTAMLADGAVTDPKIVSVSWSKITGAPSSFPPSGAAGGDLSGSYPNPTVARLQGRAVATTAPSTGQVLKWDGSAWAPGDDLRDQFWRQGPSGTIYFDGTVGIGTSVPFTGVKLDVRGRINLSYNSGSRPHLKLAEIDDPEDYARLEFVNPTGDAANRVWQIRARQIANQANEDLEVWNTARGWVLNCEGDGDVRVLATLRAAAKSFLVDHPLDPENYYLIHHCPESAEPHVYYSGTVVLDASGEAWVQLPRYFEAIARDPRYTLTPVGAPMPNLHVAVEIQENRFKIAGGVPGKRVSWRVEAIRNDPYMRYRGYQDEVPKPDEERGTYLHPELYGQPMERSVGLRGEK
jgi:hypothetical protein